MAIWKPSTIHSWKRKPVLLTRDRGEAPVITTKSGQTYTGQYINYGHHGHQWGFDPSLVNENELTVSHGGLTGSIASGASSYEGNDISSWQERSKGSLNASGSSGTGAPPGFAPNNIGHGFFPNYLGEQFPSPTLIDYKPYKKVPYKFTDPTEFAKTYGETVRGEMRSNAQLGSELALNALETELQGLRNYVPAASALKRRELSLDNQFNQEQRLAQVRSALPGAEEDLMAQRDRATAFAEGRAPDSIQDRALELGVRSRAADQASVGGFGARSSVARKASDLMSAEQRIELSRYGDQLLTQNIGTRSNLLLAPTSYSDAGAQVRVMPEVGGARLAQGFLSEANQYSQVPAQTALSANINQNQFEANREQARRQFNTGNAFQANQANAQIQNQFALTKFAYDVGYAGIVAGAAQTNANTQLQLDQQEQNRQIFEDFHDQAQDSAETRAITEGIASIPGVITAGAQAIESIGNLISGSSDPSTGDFTAPEAPNFEDTFEPNFDARSPDYTGEASAPDYVNDPLPDFSYQAAQAAPAGEIASFDSNMGVPLSRSLTDSGTRAAVGGASKAVMATAGVYDTPQPGSVPIGVSNSGRPVFSNAALMSSPDSSAGQRFTNTLRGALDPLGAFSREDATAFDKIGAVAGDVAFAERLSQLRESGDSKGFVNTLLNRFGQPAINNITDNPKDRAGLSSAYTAFQLYSNWDRMSPAQRSLGMASLGMQGFKFATGENLATKQIISPSGPDNPGLNVGQALKLFSNGYNVYSLVKNWDQLNALQKVTYGTATAAGLASTARDFGMLGAGTTGAAVPGVTAQSLASAGWSSAPQFGVGAVTGASGASVPAGYTAVSRAADGSLVAVPAANAQSASPFFAGLQTAGGIASLVMGSKAVYEGWGSGGTKGAINGALGGSAMAAGLYTLATANPFVLAGVVAVSIAGNAIKQGKSADQMARDSVRNLFRERGLSNKQHQLTLADGSTFDVGIDGHGGQHSFTNPSKLPKNIEHRPLNSYDVDYTNDLDYSASMGGIALSRLLAGGKNQEIDQLGNQLANGAIGNIGYGKEFSAENFSKMAANMRGFYAQSGIKSKADAYALANVAFAEGRIDESDLVSMHQSFNMIFDNDYSTAQKLMGGRWRGLEVAQEVKPAEKSAKFQPPAPVRPQTKEDFIRMNQQRFSQMAA